ncbi:hypothetical protein ABFA25_12315 [Mycobacterium lepromatosis]
MAIVIVNSGKKLYANRFIVNGISKFDGQDNKVDAETSFSWPRVGAVTNFAVPPSEDIDIIVLTNAATYGAPEKLTVEFVDLLQ